ncbi:RNA polymerase sigma factor [Flavobacterium pectinovorum]|uniref:RNA polymerase sigma factor n=1 Tax=Flavobacterium pectinovorum TaxID=29533 RepID=UPI001FABFB3B|nr:RNA polymerase sigma-70 factor [Flavobacterium pectinovorum]MCI9844598.1 RNA polymerase sigma-70 factor [Flavobacterium pectinovorum]
MTISLEHNTYIIEQIKKGNEEVFKFVFESLYDKLVIYIISKTNDRDISEDIVQSVFSSIWEKRNAINITYSLKSYLYKACYNEAIDHFRLEKKKNSLSEKLSREVYEEDTPDDQKENLLQKLEAAINSLPKKCREILILHKLKGFKYSEIAHQLNISIKTVQNQLFKAYKVLKEYLSQYITIYVLIGFLKFITATRF